MPSNAHGPRQGPEGRGCPLLGNLGNSGTRLVAVLPAFSNFVADAASTVTTAECHVAVLPYIRLFLAFGSYMDESLRLRNGPVLTSS